MLVLSTFDGGGGVTSSKMWMFCKDTIGVGDFQ